MTNSTDVHDAIVAADETFMTTFSRGDAAELQWGSGHSNILK